MGREKYTVNPTLSLPDNKKGTADRRQELHVRLHKGGTRSFPKEKALGVLHNALELMAMGKETDVLSFDRTEVLPYVYPLLVVFGIIPSDKARYTTRRMLADAAVCSCCGRRADYTVRTYADLIDIAMKIEEEERSRWDQAERERVELMEASYGRVSWYERAKKSTAAIRAFNREGERHFCTLCAETIRMALEDGELPSAAAPADYQGLTREAAEAGFYQYFDSVPAGGRYVDRFGSVYDAEIAGEEDESRGRIFLYREKDWEGIMRSFVCYERKFPGHMSYEAVEVHRLTKAGRIARGYTGTDYVVRTGMREEESDESVSGGVDGDGSDGCFVRNGGDDGDWGDGVAVRDEIDRGAVGDARDGGECCDSCVVRNGGDDGVVSERLRKMYIGFLELANCIRDALQNPTLEWREGYPYIRNAVSIGDRQCLMKPIGEMEVVYVDEATVQGRDWTGGKYGFMIDGRIFTGEEVALMSSMYEGGKLQYRFADPSDRPLRRGEHLMPVQLGEKELVTEVSELLNLFTADGRFISEHDERNFGVLFEKEVLKKLKLYHESNPRGYGKMAGMKVIERLRWIEGTEWQIEQVRDVVRG